MARPSSQQKVAVSDLQNGMFVSDLDRPWCETPFPLQGFYIRDPKDVKALEEYCRFVYVDVKRQRVKVASRHEPVNKKHAGTPNTQNKVMGHVLTLPPIKIKSPEQYEIQSNIKREVRKASKLYKNVHEAIGQIFSKLENGEELDVRETENVAAGMVESVIRNPDALVWLAKVRASDSHSYQHCVKASIWALVFGRSLGLSRSLLKNLATGVLLSQIGKTKLAPELLQQKNLNNIEQRNLYQEYVNHGVSILKEMENIPDAVVSVVEFHRERHNGTGFPKGITGNQIPLLAKIAGLVDFYQELIEPPECQAELTSAQAISRLFELRNIAFQEDLVEKFIQAVGVYPTGSLVELSSKEVAVVLGHNPERRLLPKVMILLDEDKNPLNSGRIVDLNEQGRKKKSSPDLQVTTALPSGAYDIDVSEYQVTGARSRWSWRNLAR